MMYSETMEYIINDFQCNTRLKTEDVPDMFITTYMFDIKNPLHLCNIFYKRPFCSDPEL